MLITISRRAVITQLRRCTRGMINDATLARCLMAALEKVTAERWPEPPPDASAW